MSETVFTDSNFAEETKKGISLVDFWATWCGPCRSQGPIIEKIAARYAGKAKVGKMNVDENRCIPAQFGVSAIPTLVILKDGCEVKRLMGLQQERTLAAALDEYVCSTKPA
jgi:thioredoxin 1